MKVKVGTSWSLPKATNFGEKISYKSLTKNCSITGIKVKALKVGACKINATATGTENYSAFTGSDSFVVTK
jgi:hypothetical protein